MFDSKLKKLGKNVVLGFFAAITLLLTLLCLFNNAYLSWDEHTTIVADKPFYLLLWFIIVLFFVYFVRKHYRTQDTYYFNKIFIILSLILLIVGIFMIFKFDFVPVADQASILEAAAGLKNGNYSYFTPMGYVGKCSNQAGIVVILYYLSFIFGENNYQAFQVLNIIGLLVSYYCLCKISQISFHNDELKNWTLILLFIFFPLTFYVAFVYGNIFGHTFSLLAILAGYQYFETSKIKYIVLSIVSIIFAMMFKSNYMIVFVAMVIFILFDIILNKKYTSIILLILFVPAYFASSMIPNTIIKNITGIELGKGIPMIAYVEMGLQDSDVAPGWYNGYNWSVYENNNGDYDVANSQAKSDLGNTLSYYITHPGEFINFLYRKTVSQWCNPDFQGTWVTRHSSFYIQSELWYQIYDVYETVILLGTLAYIYFTGRHMKLHRLLLPTIFIGGFLFHLFWEAKSQYTITYFVLLIPYCAKGLMDMTNEMIDSFRNIRIVRSIPKKIGMIIKMDTVRFIVFITALASIIKIIA